MVDKRIFPTKRPACEHKDVKGQVGMRNSEKFREAGRQSWSTGWWWWGAAGRGRSEAMLRSVGVLRVTRLDIKKERNKD